MYNPSGYAVSSFVHLQPEACEVYGTSEIREEGRYISPNSGQAYPVSAFSDTRQEVSNHIPLPPSQNQMRFETKAVFQVEILCFCLEFFLLV